MDPLSHQVSLVAFLSVLLLIALSNLLVLRRLGRYGPPARFPRVSVLLPARNEEANIRPCVQSLLAQDYPDFEVLVLNDASSDRTKQFLAEMAAGDDRLRVLTGEPLPPDWLGKHWACHQLARAASGELFLFTDADTRHGPQALRDAVAALQTQKADLLVVVPHEEASSLSTLLWGLTCLRFRQPLYLAPLHPLSILLFSAIAARSLWLAASGRATWSGRVLVRPRLRWW